MYSLHCQSIGVEVDPIKPALKTVFLNMKRLGVLALTHGWNASVSLGYPVIFLLGFFSGYVMFPICTPAQRATM